MAARAVGAGKLLAAALSESTSVPVVTYDEYLQKDGGRVQFQELGIKEIFGYSRIPSHRPSDDEKCEEREGLCPTCERRCGAAVPFRLSAPKTYQAFEFSVKTKERCIVLWASSSNTVKEIKIKIRSETGIPADQQRLMHGGRQLEDDNCLGDYNIGPDSTVFFDLRLRGGGGGPVQYFIDPSLLDEKFDYDFTKVSDDGTEYYRGGKRYYPPYGWERYALKVRGKYGDDVWLGEDRIRTESTPGEWPVSYHGLKNPEAAESIARGGYDLSRSERAPYGRGIYSSPSIEVVAEHFAESFTVNGVTYKLVYKNRVSTEGLKIVPANTPGAFGQYWVQPNDQLIRPYGLCIKAVSGSSSCTLF